MDKSRSSQATGHGSNDHGINSGLSEGLHFSQMSISELLGQANLSFVSSPNQAADLYRIVLQRDSDSIEAKSGYAKCMALLNQPSISIRLYEELLSQNPQSAAFHTNLANVYRLKDDHAKAFSHYQAALELEPDLFQALKGAAISLTSLERYDEAQAICQQAIKHHQDDQLLASYGMCLLAHGETEESLVIYQKMQQKNCLEARLLFYQILNKQGHNDKANEILAETLSEFQQSTRVQSIYLQELLLKGDADQLADRLRRYDTESPKDPQLLITLARVAFFLGDLIKAAAYADQLLDESLSIVAAVVIKAKILKQSKDYIGCSMLLEQALVQHPSHVQLIALIVEIYILMHKQDAARQYLSGASSSYCSAQDAATLASLYQSLGDMERSRQILEEAFLYDPLAPALWDRIATLNDKDLSDQVLAHLEAERVLPSPDESRIDEASATANLLHAARRYDEAAIYYKKANERQLAITGSTFDSASQQIRLAHTIYGKADLQRCDDGGSNHIFIVGMPRSGSTLLESILAINPDVEDLGEAPYLGQAVKRLIDQSHRQSNTGLAQIYDDLVRAASGAVKPIKTNKQLNNYLYVPLLVTQMPKAAVIYANRNPLDQVLSIYRAGFSDRQLSYSNSLQDIARLIIETDKLMSVFKQRYPQQIYTYNYDRLVTAPDIEIRALIYWLDWEWSDSYLAPHLNKRAVMTASQAQVRSPISAKSVGGWKRYKQMLKPAYDILVEYQPFAYLIHEYYPA